MVNKDCRKLSWQHVVTTRQSMPVAD